jgi:hypothetical protein
MQLSVNEENEIYLQAEAYKALISKLSYYNKLNHSQV